MVTAGRRRALWTAGVGLLAVVAVMAPSFPPKVLLPVSIAWLGGAAVLAAKTLGTVRRSFGPRAALAVALLGMGGPAALVGIDWSGSPGTLFPCHRNWAWLPSYLLRSSPTHSVSAEVGG